MTLKQKRNIWIFAGVCFLLGIILSIFIDGKPYKSYSSYYILNGITSILSFINAYNAHKKILY